MIKISSGTNVGSVFLALKATGFSKFQSSIQQQGKIAANTLSGAFTNGFKKVGLITATLLTAKAIESFVRDSIEIASDLAEVQNVVDVTFGSSAEKINKWAKNTTKAYGLSELSAKQYSGTMGAMLKSMGITSDKVLDMSMNITSLAGDMASFYNLDTDTAFEKIRSGISGETEPLKQLGINMSVANLEAYAMSQGISTAYSKMSQANQAILRYNYLLSVTADAQGDFSRTSNSWANQVRILTLNIDTLKSSVGNLTMQALTPLLQKLNLIIEYAIAAADALTKLFGNSSYKNSLESNGMSAISSTAIKASNDMSQTADDAKKAAKKINNAFADIDEIHVIGQQENDSKTNSSSALSNTSYSAPNATTAVASFDTSKLSNIGKVTGAALVGLGILLALTGHPALGLAMVAAGASVAAIGIDWNYTNEKKTILKDMGKLSGGALVAIGILLALTGHPALGLGAIISGATITAASLDWGSTDNKVGTVLSAIAVAAYGAMIAIGAILCFAGVSMPLGIALIAAGAVGLASEIALNWSGMSDKTKEIIEIITAVLFGAMIVVGAILALTMVNPALGVALIAAGAVGLASEIALNWNGMSDKVRDTLSIITAIAAGALLALGILICLSGTMLPLGIAILVAGAGSLAASMALNWNEVENKTGNTLRTITTVVSGALLALGVILCATGVALPLGLGLIAAGAAGLVATSNIDWDFVGKKIEKAWESISKWFTSKVAPVFKKEYWKEKFKAIGDALKDTINNKIISHLNSMINKINSFLTISIGATASKVLNALGANVSNGTFKIFSIPNIPYLANGGYLAANNPRLAIVGDNKREGEIVSPESKIREQVELALRNSGGNISGEGLREIIKQAIYEVLTAFEFAFGGDWRIVLVDERGNVTSEQIISAAQRKNQRDGKTVIRIGV